MKSVQIKLVLKIGLMIGLIAIVVVFFVVPTFRQIDSNQTELKTTKAKLTASEIKLSNLEKIQKDQSKITEMKNRVLELVPDNKDTSDFVVKTESMAATLPLTIQSINITEKKAETAKTTANNESTTTSKTKTNQQESESDATSQTDKTAKTASDSTEFIVNFKANYQTILDFLIKFDSFPRFAAFDSMTTSGYNQTNDTLDFKIQGRIFNGK